MRDVIRTEQAETDLENILAYLAQRSTPATERLAASMEQRIDRLAAQPFTGRNRGELRPGLWSVVVNPYLIFYCVTDSTLVVVRILHGARDLPALFDDASPA